MTKEQIQAEALSNAINRDSIANYPAIFEGFAEKGIPESEIIPRKNVFTFNAWKALGRFVKKGEHGVKVTTWIVCNSKEVDATTGEKKSTRRPWEILLACAGRPARRKKKSRKSPTNTARDPLTGCRIYTTTSRRPGLPFSAMRNIFIAPAGHRSRAMLNTKH